MNQNKICPDCESEYLPHIEKCADCGAILLLHEEHRRAQEERKLLMAQAIENSVVVRKGDLKWLGELRNILIDTGIPCAIISDAACNKSYCGDKCQLIVSKEDFERAQERIEEYFMEIHPDPDHALCDGPNALPLEDVRPLLSKLKEIHSLVRA